MLRSMTAFGRSSLPSRFGTIEVEISSVNRKHLEISMALPEGLGRYEPVLRNLLKEELERGQVLLRLRILPNEESIACGVKPNLVLAKSYQDAWHRLCDHLSLEREAASLLALLSRQEDLFETSPLEGVDDEALQEALSAAGSRALTEFVGSSKREGEQMSGEFKERTDRILEWIAPIPVLAEKEKERVTAELRGKVEALLEKNEVSEERLLQEVFHYVEKCDMSEELNRLDTHLHEIQRLLNETKRVSGKVLLFLTQEVLRELNTIGSKASLVEISQRVVNGKLELEKMREQLMNVE